MVAKQKNIPTKIYIYKEKNIMKFNLIRLFFVAVISLCIVGLYTISRTALAGENNTNSGSGHDYWKDHDGNSDDKTSVHGKKKRNPKKEWQTRGNKNIDAKKHFLGTTNAADLVIKTDNNEKMRVTTDGDVGIGVTNPQGKLDVGERTDPVGGTCPIGYNHVDYNEDGFIDEGECWRGMIVKNGTVGIGTVSPTLTLDVNGQIRIRGGSPFAGAVLTSDSFGNASWMSVIIDDDDSDPTNELQTMSLEGTNLTIENGNTVDLSPLQNGSTTDNQTLALTGTNLSIEDGNTVDLAALSGTDTDNQALTFSGTSLSIEDGNSVDLASLSGTDTDDQTLTFTGTSLSIADGNTVDLAALSGTNTDNQDLTSATLSGTLLSINIEGGSGTAVDLSSLQDGSGTDDQDLTGSSLVGTLLNIDIEDGTGTSVDLEPLRLWSSGTSTDIHYDPGNVGIGTTGPPTHKLTLEGANGFGLINSLSTLRVEIAYDSDGSWIDVNNAAGTPVAFLGADNEDGTGYLGVGQGTISTVAPYEELDRVSIWGGGGIFVKNNSDVSLVNILSSAGYGWVDLFDATGSSRVTLNGDQGAIKLHKNGKDGVFLHSNGFARIRNDAYATLELIGDDDNTGTEAANITMSLDGGNESWTMGTTNPETNFEQAGFFLSHYDAFGTGTAYAAMSIQGGTSTTSPTMAKGIWFNAESIGGNTGWNAASDARLKKNVSTIENALDIVDNLRGVWFDWKDTEREGREIGFIAQEVQEILPEVVNANGKFLGMQYSKITALLVEAIKELKAENEDLKATLGKSKAGNENANSMKENNELKEKLATMEKRLDKYESMMLAILNDLPRNKMVNIEQLMSDDAQKSVH